MEPFATLLLAHLIADFPLQTDLIYRLKNQSIGGLALHAGVHALTTLALVQDGWRYWLYWLGLFAAHGITDWLKLRWHPTRKAPGFLIDQFAHLAVALLLTYLLPDIRSVLPTWLLYPALIYALLPLVLMWGWVDANDHEGGQITENQRWRQQRWLRFSHLVGYPLIACVGLALIISLITQNL